MASLLERIYDVIQGIISGEEASIAHFLNLSENLWITFHPSYIFSYNKRLILMFAVKDLN